ncbi:hypothetical protein V6N11_063736 [Hibiscus sabdariffa]|uniref:Uncharacterized protein n=1 Tax=Hibiscus sabdariffa TaxID=183260 RepID=A0ABR2PLI9_9ROSI
MKAVVITTAGGPKVLQLQQVDDPEIREDEVLIKVEATGIQDCVSVSLKMVSGIACHCSSNYPLNYRIVWPAVVDEVEMNVWPALAAGKVKPIIYRSFPLSEAGEAHQLMESSKRIGKILLVSRCR